MALNKSITVDSGQKLAYWQISSVSLEKGMGRAVIKVVPYVSEAARQAGKLPVDAYAQTYYVRDMDYRGTEYEELTNLDYTAHFAPDVIEASDVDIYKMAYGYIKALPMFEGATDC